MFNIHEIFVLIVSTSVLLFITLFLKKLVHIPSWKILLTAFIIYWASTVFTIIEGFFLPDFMNTLDHLCMNAYPGVMLLWCLALSRSHSSSGGRS